MATATAASPAGAFAVQLGVSPSEGEAEGHVAADAVEICSAGKAASPMIRKAEVNGSTVFRVRVGPMAKDGASSLCSKMQGRRPVLRGEELNSPQPRRPRAGAPSARFVFRSSFRSALTRSAAETAARAAATEPAAGGFSVQIRTPSARRPRRLPPTITSPPAMPRCWRHPASHPPHRAQRQDGLPHARRAPPAAGRRPSTCARG